MASLGPRYRYVDEENQVLGTGAKNPLEHLKCPICTEYITKVVEMPCSHMACRQCLDSVAQDSEKICPTCLQPYSPEKLISSAAIQRILDSLAVLCSYKHHGCTWEGTRSESDIHSERCIYGNTDMQLIMDIQIDSVQTPAEATLYFPFLQAETSRITIDWGDNNQTIVSDEDLKYASHLYQQSGRYTVRVLPRGEPKDGCWLDHFGFDCSDKRKYHDSRGWADRLVQITQLGRLGIRSLRDTFALCEKFNVPLNHLDMSSIIDMCGTFWGATSFNQPLDKWNVSNVSTMNQMFHGARSFNQDISNWDVSNVEDMLGMFFGAGAFDKPLESWNVGKVTDFSGMFERAGDFNQSLNGWDTSSAESMSQMFRRAVSFNQPLDAWDVSKVSEMEEMFDEASSFNHPLANWNVSNVTSMRSMFAGAEKFDQPIGDWRVRIDCNVEDMFRDAVSFKQMDPTMDMNKFGVKDWKKLARSDTSNVYSLLWRLFDVTGEQREEIELLKEENQRLERSLAKLRSGKEKLKMPKSPGVDVKVEQTAKEEKSSKKRDRSPEGHGARGEDWLVIEDDTDPLSGVDSSSLPSHQAKKSKIGETECAGVVMTAGSGSAGDVEDKALKEVQLWTEQQRQTQQGNDSLAAFFIGQPAIKNPRTGLVENRQYDTKN